MSGNDYIDGPVPDDITGELDDVEGHGLKEVAVGLGVAAAVAGGTGAALTAHGVNAPATRPATASISVDAGTVIGDPVGSVDSTTDWAVATTRAARDTAL